MKLLYTVDHEQVRGDTLYAGSHLHEEPAELLDIRLAGSIIDGRSALSQNGRKDNIGSAGHRSLVEQHEAAVKPAFRSLYGVKVPFSIIVEVGTELLKPDEMSIEPTASDLVASRLREHCLAESGEHRAYYHNRPS